jgi:DNA excision repair protein ERCC-1
LWIDQESHLLHGVLNQLSAMGLERRFSLIPAWSKHEAARYIESYKFYERANADLIRGRVAPDFPTRLASALTQIKAVNKTDVRTLNNQIGSLADIANATLEELLVCKGLGATKAKRLHAAMRRPLTGATTTTATATIPSLIAAATSTTTAAAVTTTTTTTTTTIDALDEEIDKNDT